MKSAEDCEYDDWMAAHPTPHPTSVFFAYWVRDYCLVLTALATWGKDGASWGRLRSRVPRVIWDGLFHPGGFAQGYKADEWDEKRRQFMYYRWEAESVPPPCASAFSDYVSDTQALFSALASSCVNERSKDDPGDGRIIRTKWGELQKQVSSSFDLSWKLTKNLKND